MARRAAEDGYDDEWHQTFTASTRVLASMKTAADAARTAMTTEQLLTAIHHELCAIRNALEKAPAAVAPAAAARPAPAGDEDVPQPTEIIEAPETVAVHFGKNDGIPLGSLGERSVAWYAKEPEPKLDRNGKPFPPRAIDIRLRNAARTLIHQKRGTLKETGTTRVETSPASLDEGDVNF